MTLHPAQYIRPILIAKKITFSKLAKHAKLSKQFIGDIMHERSGVSYNVCIALEEVTGQPAEYWACLQATYDIHKLKEERKNEGYHTYKREGAKGAKKKNESG